MSVLLLNLALLYFYTFYLIVKVHVTVLLGLFLLVENKYI